jgi:hypothetical protein
MLCGSKNYLRKWFFFFFFFFLISKRNFIKSAFNEISLDQVKTQISNKKDVTRDEIR